MSLVNEEHKMSERFERGRRAVKWLWATSDAVRPTTTPAHPEAYRAGRIMAQLV